MKTHELRLTVSTDLDLTKDQIMELVHLLIKSGREDAQETSDDADMEDAHEDADNALSLEICIS